MLALLLFPVFGFFFVFFLQKREVLQHEDGSNPGAGSGGERHGGREAGGGFGGLWHVPSFPVISLGYSSPRRTSAKMADPVKRQGVLGSLTC